MSGTRRPPAATFLVRVWVEEGNEPQPMWRGQVEHVQSGKKQYVCELSQVVQFIEEHFADREAGAGLAGIR